MTLRICKDLPGLGLLPTSHDSVLSISWVRDVRVCLGLWVGAWWEYSSFCDSLQPLLAAGGSEGAGLRQGH